MKIGITGHTNIEKCFKKFTPKNGNVYNTKVYETIYNDIETVIKKIVKFKGVPLEDIIIVSGMARGIDEIFADFAVRNNLKLILSIPSSINWHMNRGPSRGIRAQAVNYKKFLNYENTIKINEVPKFYNGIQYKYVNMARNQNLIDESDLFLSFKIYDSVGTLDAINKSKLAKKYFGNIPDLKNQELIPKYNIKYSNGDIFNAKTHVIVNPVNTVGIMGNGLAKVFKDKYPEMFESYKKYCFTKDPNKKLTIGKLFLWKSDKYYILNFPTKIHWKDDSKLEYIEAGLIKLKHTYKKKNIKSIAFPKIGAGLGNLKWNDVEKLFYKHFEGEDLEIILYGPKTVDLNLNNNNIEENNFVRYN